MSQSPLEYAARIAYSSQETLQFTYKTAKRLRNEIGVYVECGCAAGAQIIAMCHGAPDKVVYAFDSFQGIPYPSNRDNQMPGIRMLSEWEQRALPDPGKQVLETTGATSVSEEDFMNNLKASGIDVKKVTTVPGWFEHTTQLFGKLSVHISILRLDGDLYNSTWVCLQNLFPKVIKGGVVIVDDWELPGCQAACKEYFDLIGYEPEWKFISNIAYFEKHV